VQAYLEKDHACREHLGPRDHPFKTRKGETIYFSKETVEIAEILGRDTEAPRKDEVFSLAKKMFNLSDTLPPVIQSTETPDVAPAAVVPPTQPESSPAATEPPAGGTLNPAVEPEQKIEIAYGEAKGVYTVHPVACMFPLIQGQACEELLKSLQKDGQQEECVLDGAMFLDGRNRVKAMNQLGLASRVIQFADLKTDLTPGVWIMTRNLQRRHLTDDQQLAIAAKYRAWCKAEEDRQKAEASTNNKSEHGTSTGEGGSNTTAASHTQEADGSTASEYRQKPAENQGKRKRGRPTGERTEARALAKQTKQSRYRAEQILRIRAESPELAMEVEEGRMSVKEAMIQLKAKQPEKMARSQPQYDAEGVVKAIEKATQMLSKLARKLEAAEQTTFWQQIAAIISSLSGGTEAAK